jgi:SAM-dependent methyltransferase
MTMTQPIVFVDGAAYESFMGVWSRKVGDTFIDWLAPAAGQRWLDVGCGNGAFTETLIERCAPAAVTGIDPSAGQLDFARKRAGTAKAKFDQGDAMALPYADHSFDIAVMALVIFFVPEPARGVAEMVRVVRPGGTVAAYAWDMLGGGFPAAPLQEQMRAVGIEPPVTPSVDASRMEAMRALWQGAGLLDVRTREIIVQRTFTDFEDLWTTSLKSPAAGPKLRDQPDARLAAIRQGLARRFPPAADGRITYSSRANAVSGRVPG